MISGALKTISNQIYKTLIRLNKYVDIFKDSYQLKTHRFNQLCRVKTIYSKKLLRPRIFQAFKNQNKPKEFTEHLTLILLLKCSDIGSSLIVKIWYMIFHLRNALKLTNRFTSLLLKLLKSLQKPMNIFQSITLSKKLL